MEGYVITLDKQFLIQICIQLINTGILCFILSKLLYKPVLNFLKARKEKIALQIDEADARLKEAEALKAQYEAKLKDIDNERNEILESARDSAKKNSRQIISDARKEADLIKNRAEKDIANEREKAKDDIKKEIIEVSSEMSRRFIAKQISESEQQQLFEDTLKELEGLEWTS
jgi:F-type H+-transporting ATPase subunit b